jgi:zinc protease
MRRTTRPGSVLALISIAVLTGLAQTPRPADIPRIDFEKYTLPNGLEVILSEDHRLPMVAVNLWYHVGPAHEAADRTGFAHLFEHMMFQGSKHVEGDSHWTYLAGAGATGTNGSTGFDRTNYYTTLPSNQLELALWLESDRMGYLLDVVDQAKLSNQQDVVRNERRQTHESPPYAIVEDAMMQSLFPAGHPYHGVIIGSHADIQAAKLDDVRQFFKQYYGPNNATIAIAGDIDKAATKKLIEKYFGSLKRGPAIPPVKVPIPVITAERRLVVSDRIELPRVYMGWITPAFYTGGDAQADIASSVLGGGRSSRLYKRLVYEKQLAQNVQAYQYSLMLGSIFVVEATARPGHTAEELEAAIDEELSRFRNEAPTLAEVERARNVNETQTLQGLGRLVRVADLLNQYNHYLGTPDYLTQDILRFRNVTPEAIRAFAQQYLQKNARVVVHGVPGSQNLAPAVPAGAEQNQGSAAIEAVNADEPWRAAPPKPAAVRTSRLPVPQSFQLANGLTVIVSPQTGPPVVSASLVVRTGTDANPTDRPGLASFTTAMMDQGTATRSAPQLADDAAQIGATLTVDTSTDASTVSVSSLARNLPAALNLLADVALHPSFPVEEVERIRAARLATLVQQRSNPNQIAGNVMASVLYGPAHPYGVPEIGTTDSIKRITREELQGFWRQHFVPGNSALVVAGSITVPELRKLVESTLGSWPRGISAPPKLPEPASARPRLILVDRPGSPQTQLRVVTIGASRTSTDYVPLRVSNLILGGMFSSRINMNLREVHGYTYGANSQFSFWRNPGPFAIATGVRTDVTAPAVREIFAELKRFFETRVTADELKLAKDNITQSLPASFETADRTVANFSSLFTYGLPLDHFANLTELISVVDAQSVQEMAKKYLAPDRMVIIAVGDRSRIAPGLEAELGTPAEIRDSEGVPVK